MEVKEALAWSDKHRKLKGEGARVVHIKQLLSRQRQEIIYEIKDLISENIDPDFKTMDYKRFAEDVLEWHVNLIKNYEK